MVDAVHDRSGNAGEAPSLQTVNRSLPVGECDKWTGIFEETNDVMLVHPCCSRTTTTFPTDPRD
jgi:hypothetical protein